MQGWRPDPYADYAVTVAHPFVPEDDWEPEWPMDDSSMPESIGQTSSIAESLALVEAEHREKLLLESRLEAAQAFEERSLEFLSRPTGPDLSGIISIAQDTRVWTCSSLPLKILDADALAIPSLRLISIAATPLEELPDAFDSRLHHSVRCLSLNGNRLTSLPKSIGELQGLVELHAVRNVITALPPEIGLLTKLERLNLQANSLEALPPAVSMLQRLRWLDLDGNRLTSLPAEMASLPIHRLIISRNRFVELPECCANFKALTSLNASTNQIASLPRWLHNCSRLERLDLSHNTIQRIPPSIVKCHQIRSLSLSWNHIDYLPQAFCAMTTLEELSLLGNPVSQHALKALNQGGMAQLAAWSADRVANEELSVQRRVTVRFMQVCEEVAAQGLAPSALFHPDFLMEFDGFAEHYFAIAWSQFVDEVWPVVKEELGCPVGAEESVMTPSELGDGEFEGWFWSLDPPRILSMMVREHDALGPLARENVFALFRECACEVDGARVMCAPPRPGFQCLRKCVIVKCRATRRRDLEMLHLNRWVRESVEESEQLARDSATAFVKSGVGERYLQRMALKQAEVDERAMLVHHHNVSVEYAVNQRRARAREEFAQRKEALRRVIEQRVKELTEEEAKLCDRMEAVKASTLDELEEITRLQELQRQSKLSLDHGAFDPDRSTEANRRAFRDLQIKLDKVRADLRALAHSKEIDAIEQEERLHLAHLDEVEEGAKRGYREPRGLVWQFHTARSASFQKRRHDSVANAAQYYVEQKAREAREMALARHDTMFRVMDSWQQCGLKAVFLAWKQLARTLRERTDRSKAVAAMQAQVGRDGAAATRELQDAELAKWEETVDPFTDLVGWRHCETGEWRPSKPSREEVAFYCRTTD
jgi:Leucine-rich repeat (LRR) protein